MTTSNEPSAAERAAAEAALAADLAREAAEEAQRRAEELAAAAVEAAQAARTTGVDDAVTEAGESESGDRLVGPDSGAALTEFAESVRAGYAFDGPALEIGALVESDPVPAAQVRIPFGMLNRHGLVAGATGTGKTKTLQVLAEQVAAGGVPVFAADIKGDLSGIATPGVANEKLLARCASIGQQWQPVGAATEYFTLGGMGTGVPIRATVESFGSVLLAKVLGLNATQESSLALVFHYARKASLPLITVDDLRAVLNYLTSDAGKGELRELGGLSTSTVGVIQRELIAFADQGAEVFFGLPEVEVTDFLRTTPDGRGIVSLLELPGVQDKPVVFSTFLMFLLQRLFTVLPEVGDTDKPKLVFFFDEAHLLFKDASKDFLDIVTQTVRLIRSKGVGVFFVTQTPKDVPADVLAQLGSRVQHQLRAHTPQDSKALKSTVSTYPHSPYDLEQVLTQLAIGEAIVTVMNEKGAPSPVAWTRVRAPQGSMDPTPHADIEATVAASVLSTKYGTAAVTEGAATILRGRSERVSADSSSTAPSGSRNTEPQTADEMEADWQREEAERIAREAEEIAKSSGNRSGSSKKATKKQTSRGMSPVDRAIGEASRTFAREVAKQIFKKR